METSEFFPLPPGSHHTLIRVQEVPTYPAETSYVGACRACEWTSAAPRSFYDTAWEDCYRHRQLMDELARPHWFGGSLQP